MSHSTTIHNSTTDHSNFFSSFRPIKLVIAKCWDPAPSNRGYFTIPRTEPVRPIDPGAWVAHTAAVRGSDNLFFSSLNIITLKLNDILTTLDSYSKNQLKKCFRWPVGIESVMTGAMKQGRGKCSTFKAFKLTYLQILQQLVCHLKLTQFGWVGLHGRMTSYLGRACCCGRSLKMNVLTDLLALHVHGPCFTNPLITVYGFVLG